MAKRINILNAGSTVPFADGGLKLSKSIKISEIEYHPDFQLLFKIDEELLERIINSINENGFDASQPVHIWVKTDDDGTTHNYLIDGYTRIAALKQAGHETVPYFEHKFETFDETYKYVLGLQVNRRNLEGSELLRNVSRLMGTEFIQNAEGKKSEAIAEILGVSDRTVEKAIAVSESGELSVNKAYKHEKEKKSKKETEQNTSIDSFTIEESDDFSDALDDSDGNPKGLVVSDHSDHIERPDYKLSPEQDTERTRERRNAYESGFVEGFEQAASYIFYQLRNSILMEEVEQELVKAKKNYKKLSAFIPKEEETVTEEYDGEVLQFEDSEQEINIDDAGAFDIEFGDE